MSSKSLADEVDTVVQTSVQARLRGLHASGEEWKTKQRHSQVYKPDGYAGQAGGTVVAESVPAPVETAASFRSGGAPSPDDVIQGSVKDRLKGMHDSADNWKKTRRHSQEYEVEKETRVRDATVAESTPGPVSAAASFRSKEAEPEITASVKDRLKGMHDSADNWKKTRRHSQEYEVEKETRVRDATVAESTPGPVSAAASFRSKEAEPEITTGVSARLRNLHGHADDWEKKKRHSQEYHPDGLPIRDKTRLY